MVGVKVCRICLGKDMKVYKYNQCHLKEYYEEILGNKMSCKDGLPHYFCYVCAIMLYKFHKFKERCHIGQKTLKELLWNGPITLTSISEINIQSKMLLSPIEIISVRKRVRTYNIRNKVQIQRQCDDGDNSLASKNLTDTTDIANSKRFNSEDKNSLKFESDTISNEVETCNSKGVVKYLHKSHEEKLGNLVRSEEEDSRNLVIDEDEESGNLVIDEEAVLGNQVIDEEAVLGNQVINGEVVLANTANQVIDNEKNISHDSEIVNKNDEKETNSQHKSQRIERKRKKDRDKDYVEKKKEKPKVSSKRRDLDPKFWLKITLNEEDAVKEFEARAKDPKYLSAVYKCDHCFRSFSKEDMLTRHNLLSHSESLGPIECQFCRSRFKLKGFLKRHITQHYTKYKCLRCQLICPLKSTAFFHNDYHEGIIRKCIHCGAEFKHMSTYYTHLRTHRSEHVCTLCGASFVSKLGLQLHKKIKHVIIEIGPDEEVDTYCGRCDINFETRKAYDEHLVHSAMHPEGVEGAADEPSSPLMAKRSRKSFQRSPRLPQVCNLCSESFLTKTAYIKHHRTKHNQQPLPFSSKPELKRVICEVCGASVVIGNIAIHLNIHTREKLYTCDTCGIQFNSKSSLTRHQLTHTGEKPFGCSLCNKRFQQKCSMQLHYRTIHLREPYPKRIRKRGRKSQSSDTN